MQAFGYRGLFQTFALAPFERRYAWRLPTLAGQLSHMLECRTAVITRSQAIMTQICIRRTKEVGYLSVSESDSVTKCPIDARQQRKSPCATSWCKPSTVPRVTFTSNLTTNKSIHRLKWSPSLLHLIQKLGYVVSWKLFKYLIYRSDRSFMILLKTYRSKDSRLWWIGKIPLQ